MNEPSKAIMMNCLLERMPPKLIADITNRGLALYGEGALLCGVDKLFRHTDPFRRRQPEQSL